MASLPPPPPPPPLPDHLAPTAGPPVPPPLDATSAVSTPQPTVSVPEQTSASTEPSGTSKSWEIPWNPSLVKEHAKDWSLAGDTALLLYLKEMSKDMISRTSSLGKEIDQLAASIKTCEVSTNNAFNEFITLANSQFVENRVYDEDVEQSEGAGEDKSTDNSDKKDKTKEEVEAELIPKISEAVKLGLNVLDTAYERLEVDIEDVDSDDEDPYQGEPMMEVKDPYVLRSLPVLIGSDAFRQMDNVGLVDVPSDDAASDHGSISESEEEAEEGQPPANQAHSAGSSEYSYSSSDEDGQERNKTSNRHPVPVVKKSSTSAESDSDDGDDLFGTSTKPPKPASEYPEGSESESEPVLAPPSGPVDFAAELAKKIGMPAAAPPVEVDKPASKSKGSESKVSSSGAASKKGKKSKKKKPASDDDLFGAADSDEDDGLFSSRGGLFDSGGGLFDTKGSQDDGGLFDDVPDMDVSLLKGGGKGQSSSEEDESEEERVQTIKAPAKTKQAPVKKPAAPSKDLFGSDSDDDDMFAQVSKAKPPPVTAASPDEETNSQLKPPADDSRARTASGRKVPAGAVSMFGGSAGGNPLAAALSKRRKSSSAEDDGSDWDTGKSRENSVSKPIEPVASKPPPKSSGGGGLFSSTDSDEEGDDLFGEPKAAKAPSPEQKKKLPAGAVSMFGANANPLAAALKKRAASKTSTDDVWSEEEESRKSSLSGSSQPPPSTTKPPAASSGLFDDGDDDEDDLFGSSTSKPSQPPAATTSQSRKKPAGGVALFGGADLFDKSSSQEKMPSGSSLLDDDDDQDIFSTKTAPIKQAPVKQAPAKQAPAKQAPSKGLFSDSDDDDLFSAAAKATTAPKSSVRDSGKTPAKTAKSKGLFSDSDDNDDMQGDVSPSKSAAVKPTPVKHASVKQAPVKQAPKKGLFGESDDDMFSSSSKISEQVKPLPAKSQPVNANQASGMFSDSDDDDLFSGKSAKPQTNTASNSTTKKGGSKPSQLENESPLMSTEPSTKPELSSKSKPVASRGGGLFSSVSDDDLFDSKPEAKPAASTTANKSVNKSGALFDGSDSGDDDILTKPSKSEPTMEHNDVPGNQEEKEKVEEAPKPRRPAGAVSMFGGMDPSALLKKKVGGHTADPPSQGAVTKPGRKSVPAAANSLFDSDSSDDDFFVVKSSRKPPTRNKESNPASAVSAPLSKATSAAPTSTNPDPLQSLSASPPKSKSEAISPSPAKKLPANRLGINPLAMMPGSAPPKKEPTPQAVGFDIPPENTNVLHSMNKSRARIQQKRKPPTRHAKVRGSAVMNSDTATSVPSPQGSSERVSVLDAPDSKNSKEISLSNSTSTVPKVVTKPNDLFADSTEEDGDDIFSSKHKTSFTASNSNNNDLFSTSSDPVETLDPVKDDSIATLHSSTVTKTSFVGKDPFADDSDDDFFAKSKSNISAEKKLVNEHTKDVPDLANGSGESHPPLDRETSSHLEKESPPPLDRESSPPMGKESPPPLDNALHPPLERESPPPLDRESPPPVEHPPPDIKSSGNSTGFTLDDSDDDIFSSKLTKKPKQKPSADLFDDDDLFGDSKPTKKKSVLADLDDDDDLFSIKPKSSSKRPPKAVTKDEDLFGDDDIFADIPVRVKEKKPRASSRIKKTGTSSAKASVFDDDMDDLFADLGTKKKTKAKKVDLDDDDFFGDPLGGLK